MRLLDTAGGLLNETVTGAQGIYTFGNLTAGECVVEFALPASYNFTLMHTGAAETDSDADPGTGSTEVIALTDNEAQPDWDAGMYLNVSETPEPTMTPEEETSPEGSIL